MLLFWYQLNEYTSHMEVIKIKNNYNFFEDISNDTTIHAFMLTIQVTETSFHYRGLWVRVCAFYW